LSNEAALDIAGVVAQPFIVMRNDHQDALTAGLAVSEYAPASKSADEIRGLWQWIEAKLDIALPVQEEPIVNELTAEPEILSAMFVQTPAEAPELISWSGL